MPDWFDEVEKGRAQVQVEPRPGLQLTPTKRDWFDENAPYAAEAKKAAGGPTLQDFGETTINFLRPFVASGAALGTGALTKNPVATAGAYTVTDAAMQELLNLIGRPTTGVASSVMDMKPGSIGSNLTNTAEQAVLGKIFDKTVRGIWRGGQAILNADQPESYLTQEAAQLWRMKPTASQALEGTGHPNADVGAKFLEDLAFKSKAKALDRTAGAVFTEGLQVAKDAELIFHRNPSKMLELISDASPLAKGTPSPFVPSTSAGRFLDSLSRVDKVLSDENLLQDVLTQSQQLGLGENLKKTLGGYQFMRIFTAGSKTEIGQNAHAMNIVRLDPEKINTLWNEAKQTGVLGKLYNAKTRANMEQFFKNIENTQDKIQSTPGKRFWLMHGGAAISAGMLTGHLGTNIAYPAGMIGYLLGAQTIGKLLAKESTGRLLVRLAGGEALGGSEEWAARIFVNALNGSTISAINADGTTRPMRVEDGKLLPLED